MTKLDIRNEYIDEIARLDAIERYHGVIYNGTVHEFKLCVRDGKNLFGFSLTGGTTHWLKFTGPESHYPVRFCVNSIPTKK